MITKTKRCLVYLRVSTSNQAEKGIAIPTQQEKCFACVEENKYIFNQETDVYIDRGESARTMDRPALLEMLERCKNDKSVGAIIIYDVSRLARDRVDFALIKVQFKKYGIKLISATEPINDTPEGQLLEGILSSAAEFQSTQNGRKVKANMAQKVRDGWWANKVGYGYKNVQEKLSTGKTKAWIEPNPIEVPWVIHTFELFSTGEFSERTLTKQLEKEGFPVRRTKAGSGKLHTSVVAKMLRNKLYIGVIEWGGIVNQNGKHELFLDKGLFEQVQAIIDARGRSSSRNRKLSSILKHNSFCDECGSKMTVEQHKTSNGTIIQYLRCMKAIKNERVQCSQKYFSEDEYVKQFIGLLKLINLPQITTEKLKSKIRNLFASEQDIYEKARKSILAKIEDTKRKKKNLVLKLIDTDKNTQADNELYISVKAELDQNEVSLNADLAKVENKIVTIVRTIEIAVALANNCIDAFLKTDTVELKALLARTFFKKIFIRDGKIVRAVFNEPLDYICRKQAIRSPIFDLASVCGQERT